MNISLLNRFLEDTAFLLESRCAVLLEGLFDTQLAEHPAMKRMREAMKPQITMELGDIASIPIQGVLAYKPDPMEMDFFGLEDSNEVRKLVQSAAADKSVKGILLDINSPGGFETGIFEIGDAVDAASKIKPVLAHIGGVGASAAYLIASQANEIMANRAAKVGSIGAYNVNIDRTRMIENAGIKVEVFKNKEAKFKAMGHVGTSLNDEQRAYASANAQASFDEFKAMILAKRKDVSPDCMQGQLFSGKEACARNLVDSVGTYENALMKLKGKIKQ